MAIPGACSNPPEVDCLSSAAAAPTGRFRHLSSDKGRLESVLPSSQVVKPRVMASKRPGVVEAVLARRLRLFAAFWCIICIVFSGQVHEECSRSLERTFAIPFVDVSSFDPLRLLLPPDRVCAVLSGGMVACAVVCLVSRTTAIFRAAAAMLALLQTLHFVSDSLFYQNHTYLMVLTSWSLCFMPGDVIEEEWPWATPKRGKKLQKTPTPAGSYGLALFLKGVFLITFFSGSLRKINPDWLSFHPLLEWIPMQLSVKFPLLLPLSDWIAVAMSVAGIVVDALIPMLLVSATTAWAGVGLLVAFMVTNGLLWEIDIFPMITLAYSSLFVPWKSGDSRGWSARSRADSAAWVALACFLVVSSALPSVLWLSSAQHYAGEQPEGYSLPSSVDTMWAECGMEFTWRMMLRFKDCEVFFFLVSPSAGRAYFVNVERLVNQAEYLSLAGTPYQLLHFSHILASGQFASVYPGVHWDDIQVYAMVRHIPLLLASCPVPF